MHSQRIYNGSSTHLGFCEPITKNEKIEKESGLNGGSRLPLARRSRPRWKATVGECYRKCSWRRVGNS